MKKIGILIDELFNGGFQRVAVMETIYLRKLGYDANLVVLRRGDKTGYQDLLNKYNVKPIYLSDRFPKLLNINFKIPFFNFFSFFHISYPFFIYKYISNNEFDIFITHGTYTTLSSISIHRHKKIPYVGFIHDSISYILSTKYKKRFLENFLSLAIPLGNFFDKIIIKNALAVLAYPHMITYMKNIFPEYSHYHPLLNGCIPSKLSKSNRSNFYISVTKWDKGKNLDLLLELYQKSGLKIPLKIIGRFEPFELKKHYDQKIKQCKLDNIIHIVGEVSEDKLNQYYRNATLLIHPCKEAFGMTILEAAANGCPSIFTQNSGVNSLFKYTNICTQVKEGKIDDYLKKIKYIQLLSTSDYESLVHSFFLVAKKNSWDNHCKKILNVIESNFKLWQNI